MRRYVRYHAVLPLCNAACIVIAAGMLLGTSVREDGGAPSNLFFRVKWLERAMKVSL